MSTSQNENNRYLGRNVDGFVCSYDANTHRCIGVILAMGDNIDLYEKNHDRYIGEIDPKYKDKQY